MKHDWADRITLYEIIVWGFDDVFIDSDFCGYLNFDISELVYIAH